MRDKGEVGANLYVEDSSENIIDLRNQGKDVVILSNATNQTLGEEGRAEGSSEAEEMIRSRYYSWLDDARLDRPPGVGVEPDWAKTGPRPAV
jgi:CRISPR/Cas system-associated protein Csx1